jgi:hypothetical protein
MRSVWVTLIAVGLLAADASAKEKELQRHEVDGDIDLNVVSLGNEAIFKLRYTFTPEGIDRNDEVPPILRRFLLHPASLWFEIAHDGGTRDAITRVELGGELHVLDGHIYARTEGGLGRHLTVFDEPYEFGYWFATAYGEVGFRPVNGIEIGAFYRGSPILGPDKDDKAAQQAERSGLEQNFGALVTFATPNDRIYATVSGYGIVNDWKFKTCVGCLFPGDETVRGFGGSVRVAFQLTLTTSLQLQGSVERNHWIDSRVGEDAHFQLPLQNLTLDRSVWSAVAEADFIYWYAGRYGFRLSAGGGYNQAPPLLNARTSGLLRLGGGVLLRF